MSVVRIVAIIMVALGVIVIPGALLHDLVLAPDHRVDVDPTALAAAILGAIDLTLGLILLFQKKSS